MSYYCPFVGGWLELRYDKGTQKHIDVLVQESRNSTANSLELRLSCTNTSIYVAQNVSSLVYNLQHLKLKSKLKLTPLNTLCFIPIN